MIQDTGEIISGAKKMRQAYTKSLSVSDDTESLPLSKSFPKPNMKAMIEEGADPSVVVLIGMMRDMLPAKPKSDLKVIRWSQKVDAMKSSKVLNHC